MRYQGTGNLRRESVFGERDPLGTFRHLEQLDSEARHSLLLDP
jgi:hypothetical protein